MNIQKSTLLLCTLLAPFFSSTLCGAELEKLKYNNPGLVVDLGVGLWSWPIPCDADGDGDFDLIVSCPDKPSNGIWFFENQTGETSKNKFPVFKPARKLSSTVHYVLPSYVDGKLHVLSPGVEHPNFEKTGLKERSLLPLKVDFHKTVGNAKGARTKVRHNEWRLADYDGDGVTDIVVGIEDWTDYGWDDAFDSSGKWTNGPLHGFVYWVKNTGSNEKPAYAEPTLVQSDGKPVDTYGCPTPNFADFDGDGDLDLLCGEFVDSFTYFENVGSRKEPKYSAGRKLKAPDGSTLAMELQMIVPIAFDWDKDGDLDLVVGDEDGRVALVENTGKLSSDRMPQFLPPHYFQQEADELKSGALANPVGIDWDADGDFDLLSGNTAGFIEFFENLSGPKVASPKWAAPKRLEAGGKTFRVMAGLNGGIQGPCERKWGYTTISAVDWNLDGLPDIVFNSIRGEVSWLRNIGSKGSPKLAAPEPIEVEWEGTTPKPEWVWWTPKGKELITQWRTTPVAFDFNRDGLPDLGMLDQEGYLAYFKRAKNGDSLVLLPPQRIFIGENGAPLRLNEKRAGGSGRRKLCVTDWDGDGKFDFLLNSANADFLHQIDSKADVWEFENRGSLAKQNIEGHDVAPTTVDFDGNGIPDFVGGAEDGRLYLLINPRAKK